MALRCRAAPLSARAPALPARRALVVRASAAQEPKPVDRLKQAALAGVVATSLLLGSAVAPEEAFAARSGGRVSSSGFSARRSAPRAAPAR